MRLKETQEKQDFATHHKGFWDQIKSFRDPWYCLGTIRHPCYLTHQNQNGYMYYVNQTLTTWCYTVVYFYDYSLSKGNGKLQKSSSSILLLILMPMNFPQFTFNHYKWLLFLWCSWITLETSHNWVCTSYFKFGCLCETHKKPLQKRVCAQVNYKLESLR